MNIHETKKIAVIGSGPSGALASYVLLHHGFSVEMLDIGKKFDSDDDQLTGQRLGLKSLHGSFHAYDLQNITGLSPMTGTTHSLIPSVGFGGFSTFWGAAASSPSSLPNWLIEGLGLTFSTRDEILKMNSVSVNQIQTKYPLDRANPLIAIDATKCTLCGRCLIGCPENAFWSSLGVLKKMQANEHFEYTGGVCVEKILDSNSSGKKTIEMFTTQGKIKRVDYDAIFLGAGVVGTSSILLKSELTNQVALYETQLGIMPFFKRKRGKTPEKFSALSDALDISVRDLHIHYQLYFDSFYSLLPKFEGLPLFAQKIAKFIWKIISPWIGVALIYIGEAHSDRALLTKDCSDHRRINVEVVHNSLNKQAWRLAIKSLKKSTLKGEVLFMGLLLRKLSFGGSNHVRGDISESKSKLFDSNIVLIDAMSMDTIEPGPVTIKIMENAFKEISDWIEVSGLVHEN